MGRKIFISYKYADRSVYNITQSFLGSTVRDYVNKIEESIDKSDHIFKAERDNEDLSYLSEDSIWEKLKNRIYDSSLTIVMISKNIRDFLKEEKNQWIPREISYSLKAISRINKVGQSITSKENAILAVVIPDENNSYDYYIEEKNCCTTGCTSYNNSILFKILSDNMFNKKIPNKSYCDNNSTIYYGDSSYVCVVKWDDFIKNINKYIDKAYEIRDSIEDYKIVKELV